MDFTSLPRFSTDINDYPLSLKKGKCYQRAFQVEISSKLNAQAERLEWLFLDILTSPDHQEIQYKDILPWRQRAEYLKSQGQARAAKRLMKAEALREAKEADEDEEFMTGYKEFLDSEFIVD
mgnify:CR=1 FL=1|tara:strand:- start:2244 stop:2609 length:366 start_codon:yes stop_codon:yes gene_type:complete